MICTRYCAATQRTTLATLRIYLSTQLVFSLFVNIKYHLETWVIMLTLHIALKWVIMLTLHIALMWVIMLVLHISFLGQYVTHGDSLID